MGECVGGWGCRWLGWSEVSRCSVGWSEVNGCVDGCVWSG